MLSTYKRTWGRLVQQNNFLLNRIRLSFVIHRGEEQIWISINNRPFNLHFQPPYATAQTQNNSREASIHNLNTGERGTTVQTSLAMSPSCLVRERPLKYYSAVVFASCPSLLLPLSLLFCIPFDFRSTTSLLNSHIIVRHFLVVRKPSDATGVLFEVMSTTLTCWSLFPFHLWSMRALTRRNAWPNS